MRLRLRVVCQIESAVQSITTCTAPTVQVGGVTAWADRMCSPYVSRRTVEYAEADFQLPSGAVYAASPSYALLLGVAGEPEKVVPPFPVGGLVTVWEGGLVPAALVQPVLGLARELGLRPQDPRRELIHVWVLSPVLAGWHYGRPVFWAAGEGNAPAALEGEPAHQQGALLVGWCGGDVPQAQVWPCWAGQPSAWFFNHATAYEGRERAMNTVPAESMAHPVAVMYQCVPHAAVRLYGPALIVARDHEDLTVPEGDFLGLHPFPTREGDVD